MQAQGELEAQIPGSLQLGEGSGRGCSRGGGLELGHLGSLPALGGEWGLVR